MRHLSKVDIKLLYNSYVSSCNIVNNNKQLFPKIRRPNFPEVVSEHLVLFYLQGINRNNTYCWSGMGDLTCNTKNNVSSKIEVKCSSSTGPLSFGPTQHWDELYLVDAADFMDDNMKLYQIVCSKEDFGKIKVSKSQTFLDQCNEKRRPRLPLKNILQQLEAHCVCLYDGRISMLLDNH